MMEYGCHAWDLAALKPIVEEAGGRYSDWSGQPNIHRPDALASNGKLHDVVLQTLFDPVTSPRPSSFDRPFGD
jgi:histidinol-phosphatase